MAERGGFEPPVGFYTYGALAKRCFRPLSHLSKIETRNKAALRKAQGLFSVFNMVLSSLPFPPCPRRFAIEGDLRPQRLEALKLLLGP